MHFWIWWWRYVSIASTTMHCYLRFRKPLLNGLHLKRTKFNSMCALNGDFTSWCGSISMCLNHAYYRPHSTLHIHIGGLETHAATLSYPTVSTDYLNGIERYTYIYMLIAETRFHELGAEWNAFYASIPTWQKQSWNYSYCDSKRCFAFESNL